MWTDRNNSSLAGFNWPIQRRRLSDGPGVPIDHWPSQDIPSVPSQDYERESDTNNNAYGHDDLQAEKPAFPNTVSSSLPRINLDSAPPSNRRTLGHDPIRWLVADLGPDIAPPLANSALSGYVSSSSFMHSTLPDPSLKPTLNRTTSVLAPGFDVHSLIKPQADKESHSHAPSFPSSTAARRPADIPVHPVPGSASPVMKRVGRRSTANPLIREEKRPHSLRSSNLPLRGRKATFFQGTHSHLGGFSHEAFQSSLSLPTQSADYSRAGSRDSEPELHLSNAMLADDGAVALTWETFDWMFSVMYPKLRSDKRIPTPSGKCLLCPSVCKNSGILQQHLAILHRRGVARKFIMGLYTPFDLVIALALLYGVEKVG